MITVENITRKIRKNSRITDTVSSSSTIYCADIEPNIKIRLYGVNQDRIFDLTFRIYDMAEYGAYNLVYYGPIVQITTNTVTIEERFSSNKRRHRLDLYTFAWRNYNFDLQKVQKNNSEWRD